MTMSELDPEELVEEVLKKSGPELFKELYRLYPVAEVEDYYKMGAWKNDIMRADIVLLSVHREEAGSPDPPPIEDIKIPGLPMEQKAWNPSAVMPVLNLPKPGAVTIQKPGIISAAANAATGSTVAELRLIAIFVAKWKLDPTKTKALLAKLTPERRRHIVTSFKTDKTGPEATEYLENFVAQCEKDGSWDKAGAKPASAVAGTTDAIQAPASKASAKPLVAGKIVTPKLGGVAAPKPAVVAPVVGGVKRPWGATAEDNSASKWPKTSSPAKPAIQPPKLSVRPPAGGPQVVSATRPGAPKAAGAWGGAGPWGMGAWSGMKGW